MLADVVNTDDGAGVPAVTLGKKFAAWLEGNEDSLAAAEESAKFDGFTSFLLGL